MSLLKKILLGSATFALAGAAWAAAPLLDAKELAQQITNIRVLDIRPADAYGAGHIPGAVSAPYAQWRGPAENPGKLPDVSQLTELVRSLGIGADDHVLVASSGADSTDFGASARVYWTLKYLGLQELSVLNGGYKAWQDAGLALETDAVQVNPSDFQASLNQQIIVSTEQVAQNLGNKDVLLLDARPLDFYLGKLKAPSAQVPGTIEGAVNLDNSRWFVAGTSRFVDAEQAQKIAAELLPQGAKDTIAFCNTGHWAATDWFALSEVLGQENVRLYPESMAEWSQNPDLPMENVPGRGSQILDKLKGVFG